MADDSCGRKAKRRKKNDQQRKLLTGEKVEVLYTDEGLNGSWHGGIVIGVGEYSRTIEYTDILNDDNCSKLVESVHVSAAIEGLCKTTTSNYRGRIRPSSPHYEFQESEVKYGLCVDALVDDVWWEGVIFDHEEGFRERLIFFPDQGDQQIVNINNLRVTLDWNEVSGGWVPRGGWVLLEVLRTYEEGDELPVSIREVWYDLRTTNSFLGNIGMWMFGSQSAWLCLVSELIQELNSVAHGLVVVNGVQSNELVDAPLCFSDIVTPAEDFPRLEEINNSGKLTILPHSSLGKNARRKDSHEVTENEVLVTTDGGVQGKGDFPLPDYTISNQKQGLEALSNFISEYKNRFTHSHLHSSERFNVTREMAKCYLLSVGWKLEMTRSGNKYVVSPDGKHFSSLIKACKACEHMQSRNPILGDAECKFDSSKILQVPKSWKPVFLEAAYCPEAIELYAYSSKERKPQWKESKGADDDDSSVRLMAKKHLLTLGWKIESRRDTMLRFSFTSPEGKRYYSLRTVCIYLLTEHQKKNKKSRIGNGFYSDFPLHSCLIEKGKEHEEHSSHSFGFYFNAKKSKKRKAPKTLTRKYRKPSRSFPRPSCKTPCQVVPYTIQQVPRTVLSLLIDNDMVLPRQKVQYIRRKDGHVMMEGRITRDGIKCKCCNKVFTLTKFEVHAGSTYHRPSANIFLQDGRSLLECQMQMVQDKKPKEFPRSRRKNDFSLYQSDTICSICHDGGNLVLCDHCPSSFHLDCVGLEDVPKGKWFCPSCRCGICGMSEFNPDPKQFMEKTVLYCDQCEREYHVGCLREKGLRTLSSCPDGNWFCSKKCSKIFFHFRKLLGKSKPTDRKGLTWTILRSSRKYGIDGEQFDAETKAEHDSKLYVALDVLHECFVTIIEPRTKSDLVSDIIFNKESELNRLNFWGFYTMILEREDELISVATFRAYGDKVAEMPLVGTRVKYRRQGMCRLLVNELEKLLSSLGVERLMLPAVPQLLPTWTNSFGFTTMRSSDRLGFLEYSLLNFQDTTMCQKLLRPPPTVQKNLIGNSDQLTDMYSIVSEVVEIVEPITTLPTLSIEMFSSPSMDTASQEIGSEIIPACCVPMNSFTVQTAQAEFNGSASPIVPPAECRESSLSVEKSPNAVVKPLTSTDLNPRLLGKCSAGASTSNASGDQHLSRGAVRNENTFKFFYRRRISAN